MCVCVCVTKHPSAADTAHTLADGRGVFISCKGLSFIVKLFDHCKRLFSCTCGFPNVTLGQEERFGLNTSNTFKKKGSQ